MRPRAGSIQVPSFRATSMELAYRSARVRFGNRRLRTFPSGPRYRTLYANPPRLRARFVTDAMSVRLPSARLSRACGDRPAQVQPIWAPHQGLCVGDTGLEPMTSAV